MSICLNWMAFIVGSQMLSPTIDNGTPLERCLPNGSLHDRESPGPRDDSPHASANQGSPFSLLKLLEHLNIQSLVCDDSLQPLILWLKRSQLDYVAPAHPRILVTPAIQSLDVNTVGAADARQTPTLGHLFHDLDDLIVTVLLCLVCHVF